MIHSWRLPHSVQYDKKKWFVSKVWETIYTAGKNVKTVPVYTPLNLICIVKYLHNKHYTSVITLVCTYAYICYSTGVTVQQHRSNSPWWFVTRVLFTIRDYWSVNRITCCVLCVSLQQLACLMWHIYIESNVVRGVDIFSKYFVSIF